MDHEFAMYYKSKILQRNLFHISIHMKTSIWCLLLGECTEEELVSLLFMEGLGILKLERIGQEHAIVKCLK